MVQHLKHILASPRLYLTFSRLLGGTAICRTLVQKHLRPKPNDKILDIGCGPARILEFLPDVDYTGFDLSASYIEMAQKRYGKRGRFFCQKVSPEALQTDNNYDLVLASGVLHHLSDSDAVVLFKLARAALKKGGRLVTFDGCYQPGQSRIARYLLSRDRGEFVRTQEAYAHLAAKVFSKTNIVIHHDLLRIPYTHIIMECQAS